MDIELYDHQKKAIEKLDSGKILCGGVGTGKSRTALAYYFSKENDGKIDKYSPMTNPNDLYIITTARKRDTMEWEGEMVPFLLSTDPETNTYSNKVVVDSWNNIKKYSTVENAFFIFDEQRVVGYGVWTKSFLEITKHNRWILLTATPGDTWLDYMPVFIANGFYKHKTDFIRHHVVFSRFSKYPKVERYVESGKLLKYKRMITVDMPYRKTSVKHNQIVTTGYDKQLYFDTLKSRWNSFKDEPIRDAGQLCYVLRRIVNSSQERVDALKLLLENNNKTIIFYNFDYELDILKSVAEDIGRPYSEWNGHKHQPIPKEDSWMYLVQYTAGAEGWNCTSTNTIIFYSQNYSYKTTVQAAGRIDRLNTPYHDLYYYRLRSNASIDLAIYKALVQKKNFNESSFSC